MSDSDPERDSLPEPDGRSVYARLIHMYLVGMRATIETNITALRNAARHIEEQADSVSEADAADARAQTAARLVREIDQLLETNADFQRFLSSVRARASAIADDESARH